MIAKYEYDADGRRVKSTVAGAVINYHYDGDSLNVLYETNGSGNLTTLYAYSDDGLLLSMNKIGDGINYYHYNGHGDVTQLTDQNGDIVADYTYDAWGNILQSSGTMASSNPYRYAGYRYDNETGMYYVSSRYYSANLGRFISKDKFDGFEDDPASLNQYAYADCNPVMFGDPSGCLTENVKYNTYLGSGSIMTMRILTSNYGRNGSIKGSVYLRLTRGFAAISSAGFLSSIVLKRIITKWLVRNTNLKEILQHAIKISFIATIVYNTIIDKISKVVKYSCKYMDRKISRIPTATTPIYRGTINISYKWSI